MSDLMMNIKACVTDNTTYDTLLTPWCGVWQITMSDLMMNVHTHMFQITLLISCCMADPYARINDECTHKCYL